VKVNQDVRARNGVLGEERREAFGVGPVRIAGKDAVQVENIERGAARVGR